ncbi:hypothetical protein ES703_63834 [subsurface metagenome]
MEVPKASEILEDCINGKYPLDYQDYQDAMQLGVEALDLHQSRATLTPSAMLLPLPSETQDQAGEG